jgi:hypothetical protein
MSDTILHHQILENGLELTFVDLSNRYYGDFYQIKIDVVSHLSLSDSMFAKFDLSEKEKIKAKARFGARLESHRELKRMGVAGGDVVRVCEELVQQFLDTSLPYLSTAEFPSRLLRQRLVERPVLKKIYG